MSEFQKIIDGGYNQYMKLQKVIQEKGFDKKFAGLMLGQKNPDDEFMARKLLELTSKFDEIGNDVIYLHKPVRKQGLLRIDNGHCYLDDEEMSDGSVIEYMDNEKWYIGKLNTKNGQIQLLSEDGKSMVDLKVSRKVRVR